MIFYCEISEKFIFKKRIFLLFSLHFLFPVIIPGGKPFYQLVVFVEIVFLSNTSLGDELLGVCIAI